MDQQLVITDVRVRDNGLRSFIPPCYCWELLDRQGNLKLTVSDVQIDRRLLQDNITLDDILNNNVFISGILQKYKPSAPANKKGIRLMINEKTHNVGDEDD